MKLAIQNKHLVAIFIRNYNLDTLTHYTILITDGGFKLHVREQGGSDETPLNRSLS